MKRSLLSFVCLIFYTAAYSTNYFCSPHALGDGSSYGSPCSFTDGIRKLTSAGDTLFCLGGQYDYTSVINITLTAGNAAKNIVICNYANEKPIFDWRKEAYGERGLVIKSGTQYLTIKGLTLRYTGKNALLNNGSNCTFENLDVYGNGDTGIQMKGGGNNYIINCDSHDNFDYRLGDLTAADYGGNADGFADKQFTGACNTYIGCRAWNNSDDGWDFYQRNTTGSTPTIIQNCICYRNGQPTYDMRNHPRYEVDKSWFDQFQSEITIIDADRQQVKASLAKYPNMGNGNGFKIGGAYTANHVSLYQCLAVANTARGFDQNNNYGEMVVYNGSAYMNGTDYGFLNNGGGSLVIKNCISFTNSYSLRVPTTQSNNSWSNSNLMPQASDFVSLDTSLILSPRQADGSLPEIMFMHLQSDSKFIDAGVDVGLGYSGNAPDLGCYEYGSSNAYPATLTCTTNNLLQSVKLGNPISTLSFKWGGSATGAEVQDLPQGLTSATDDNARIISINGIPQEAGTFTITVTTQGGNSNVSMTATIIVKDNNAVEIAYVTIPNSDADQPILDYLLSNSEFSVNILDANNAKNDYEQYGLIILSPVPNSTSSALAELKGINKPMLLLKPFMLKSTVWNWGNSQNSSQASMQISMPEHPIFNGINLNENRIQIFNSVNTNGVTYISEWYGTFYPISIASPMGLDGISIAEIPEGNSINGTLISDRFLMIGVSEYSTSSLTLDALKLIENACYYLLRKLDTSIRMSKMPIFEIFDSKIVLKSDKVANMRLYDISGREIRCGNGNVISTIGLSHGLYMISVEGKAMKIVL